MSEHTPGPWNVGDMRGTTLMVYCYDAVGSRVADCRDPGHGISQERAAANVRLIAAAPDLLDALIAFHRAAKSWHDFHHGSNDIACDLLCECIAPAAAAISKATGSKEHSENKGAMT